jgi:hypothetical protein
VGASSCTCLELDLLWRLCAWSAVCNRDDCVESYSRPFNEGWIIAAATGGVCDFDLWKADAFVSVWGGFTHLLDVLGLLQQQREVVVRPKQRPAAQMFLIPTLAALGQGWALAFCSLVNDESSLVSRLMLGDGGSISGDGAEAYV